MKILRLKLENFIGIKHGLNQNVIEIDFTKCENKIVMIRGENGSGKSTIMSQLHPFKESFDERKELILDGKTGRKEIDYLTADGNKYEIVHIYGKSAQSFIKKNGVELNENGGVRTFEDIVKKELGITKDYSKIGKIGSNTKNFIDFTAAERKNYIGNFLDIEDILDKYTTVNNQLKVLKKDIQSVGGDLSKLKDKDTIKIEIEQSEAVKTKIEEELNTLYQLVGELNSNIKHEEESLKDVSLSSLLEKINEKKSIIEENKRIKETVEPLITEKENLDEFKETLEKDISRIKTEISVNNTNLKNTLSLLTEYKNSIQSLKIELESLGNPEDLKKTNNDISKTEDEIQEIKNTIKEIEYNETIKDMLKDKKDISSYLEKFIAFTSFIEKYFSELKSYSFIKTKMNISCFLDDSFSESFKRQVNDAKLVIQSKEKLLAEEQKLRGEKEAHICLLKNLEKRPSDCHIDDCPFIKDALIHKNVISEIDEKDSIIKQIKKEIEDLNIKLENLQSLQNLEMNFRDSYQSLKPQMNNIYIKFTEEKSLIDWISGPLYEFQRKRQEVIDEISNLLDLFNSYSTKTRILSNLKDALVVLKGSDESIRNKYLQDIENNTKRVNEIETEYNNLKEESQKLSVEFNDKLLTLDNYTKYIQSIKNISSASTMLSAANTDYVKFSEINKNLINNKTKLKEISNKIIEMNKIKCDKTILVDKLKALLVQVETLGDKLDNLKKQYGPVSVIATALSPTTGIPLILMKTYLDETESIANELLSIAFNGTFSIKFLTTEKEFSIQVQSKDNIKSDIKMASQGEIAITTISISLALIEQSIGDYNILCLDEIDGPLDYSNRQNFINILNSQIEKLGIEQVFIISHNDAFDAFPLDLILLKGSKNEEMENKNIVFSI